MGAAGGRTLKPSSCQATRVPRIASALGCGAGEIQIEENGMSSTRASHIKVYRSPLQEENPSQKIQMQFKKQHMIIFIPCSNKRVEAFNRHEQRRNKCGHQKLCRENRVDFPNEPYSSSRVLKIKCCKYTHADLNIA